MCPQDLWGEIPIGEAVRTPYVILGEQALLLGQKTKNVLEGRATRRLKDGKFFVVILYVVAPVLDGYTYGLVRVTHGPKLYPLRFEDLVSGENMECEDEDALTGALGKTLASEGVKKVIGSLLSQSSSEPA